MSFSSGVKEDLVKYRLKTDRQRLAALSGLTLCCGSLYLGRGRGASYATETLSVGKLILSLATGLYNLDASMGVSEREGRRRPLTLLTLTGKDGEALLLDTGLLVRSGDGLQLGDRVPPALTDSEECARAFLRGAFLGSGSCANPARGFHLEIVVRGEGTAADIAGLIQKEGVSARRHRRKDQHVVYCKGEDVSGFLILVGAGNAALTFENVRTEKDFRNYVNRTSNCETANIGKTVDAALAQREAIEKLERHRDLAALPQPLYEAALLRLSHPEATLQELADLAEIGKSGMNHRLARLLRLAREIE